MAPYREDAELLAVWCAFLNLEVSFGDEDSVAGVFKVGIGVFTHTHIHTHILVCQLKHGGLPNTPQHGYL